MSTTPLATGWAWFPEKGKVKTVKAGRTCASLNGPHTRGGGDSFKAKP